MQDDGILTYRGKMYVTNSSELKNTVLREIHNVTAKLCNHIFYQKTIHYLGHIISAEGIEVDPEKIEAIRGWPTQRNITEVRLFMGLADYY